MSASPENRPSTSSAKFNLAQILMPKSPKLLTYKAKIPKSNNKSALLPVLSSQNHSPDLLHQTLSNVSPLKLELHDNTPSNDNLETGSGLIRDPTPTANSKGSLAPPSLSPSFSGYNLYRQHKQNRALRVNTSATPLRDFLSCTPSPSSATLNTHGNVSPVRRPSKFEESSKVEPSRPGTKQGESNILGLTAMGFESPVKRPVRPRLTQVGKPHKNNFLSGLVSPINLASTQKIRKSFGFVQGRVENTNANENTAASPKKADGIRKPLRHRTLPLSVNNSPQASAFLSPSFNVNKSGRKSEMRESPNPSGHESNKNLLSVPKKFDERRRSSGKQSLLPFLREPSPTDFDNKTPEGSTNTSSMKSKLPQEVFSEIVEFQNNKMPFHMTWNAETRQRLFTEIKKKASDRGNLDDIWNIREIEVPQEKAQFLEKKIDKMVEQKKKDIGSRSPVKSALYQFYALDGNTRKKIKGKLEQQLAQEPRFFDLQ